MLRDGVAAAGSSGSLLVRIVGVDFTSAPSARKAITVAYGRAEPGRAVVERVDRLADWPSFEALLSAPGPWVGAFDFPFGLARGLVVALGWPGTGAGAEGWREAIAHYAALDRAEVGRVFGAFRAARPVGRKYAHRATEVAAGAHASMKLVNPPVGWMLHEGAPRLARAGVHLPGIAGGDRSRVALEAYPGMVMREISRARGLGRTPPYKNDSPRKQTPELREARVALLWGLVEGEHRYGVRVDPALGLAAAAIDDGTGDTLDAMACAMLAAWAAGRAEANYGLPVDVDPLEGWIVGAQRR